MPGENYWTSELFNLTRPFYAFVLNYQRSLTKDPPQLASMKYSLLPAWALTVYLPGAEYNLVPRL